MARPDWKDVDTYEIDTQEFPYRAYAWEFLRRNPDFQRESEAAFSSGLQSAREKVATKYGLRDLVSYRVGYEPFEPSPVWLAETICEPPIVHQKGKLNRVPHLRPGEVALIFDLDATLGSGPAAIDAFLWNAKNLLMAERRRLISGLPPEEPRVVRAKSPSIRKSKLFTWIRTYDAVVHMRVPQIKVARALYPEDFVPEKYTGKTKASAAQKRVSDDRKRAMSLVDNEYLALIPLDYLQDKSKR
jgi:hypothetical protein